MTTHNSKIAGLFFLGLASFCYWLLKRRSPVMGAIGPYVEPIISGLVKAKMQHRG